VPEDGGQLEGVGLLLEAQACSSVTQGQAVLSQLLHTIHTITISITIWLVSDPNPDPVSDLK
jgi:hypothetical protein